MIVQRIRCLAQYFEYGFAGAGSHLNWRDCFVDAPAATFHKTLTLGYEPEAHIDVLPQFNLIYVGVPKCASTTIKAALAVLNGKASPALGDLHTRRRTGLLSPSRVGLSTFYRIATDPTSLRFAFVRNPYARLVSAWADKLKSKPLVPGDAFVEVYLQHRFAAGTSLPYGKDQIIGPAPIRLLR